MYLPIGNDMAVREQNLIGIFDMDNASTSKWTRAFLAQAEKQGQIVPFDELPVSFVLTQEYGMAKIYLSSQSSRKLAERCTAEAQKAAGPTKATK